jgi:hypothetical protein
MVPRRRKCARQRWGNRASNGNADGRAIPAGVPRLLIWRLRAGLLWLCGWSRGGRFRSPGRRCSRRVLWGLPDGIACRGRIHRRENHVDDEADEREADDEAYSLRTGAGFVVPASCVMHAITRRTTLVFVYGHVSLLCYRHTTATLEAGSASCAILQSQ